jgi:hypothetical protein
LAVCEAHGFCAGARRGTQKVATIYEDNFGFWEIDGQVE